MEEELKSKNNNSTSMNTEDVIQNNNNNNNINHDTKKLVLTIKVNDETEPVNSNSGGNENEKIIHVNGSTAIHIMTPPSAQPMSQHNNGSSAISSIPINIPNGDQLEYLNGVSVKETDEVDDELDGDGEEFDFSSSDFEDAQEEVSAASDHVIRSDDNVNGNISLTLSETSDLSILQSPGPMHSNKSMELSPDIVDIDTDQEELSVSHRKSIDESEGQTGDDVLISEFFGKANEIVGFIYNFICIYVCLMEIGINMGQGDGCIVLLCFVKLSLGCPVMSCPIKVSKVTF